jgi:ABC-type transport system involved in multi-copper enzyme maturation permease subunit
MLTNVRAELIKTFRRPAVWLLFGIACLLDITFTYLIPYAGLSGNVDGPTSNRGLASMLPPSFIGNSLGGMPIFVGALALIFGVLVIGTEYASTTWKTVLAQGPSRAAVYGAKLGASAIGALILTASLFAVSAASSAVVATLKDQPMHWPGFSDLATGFAAGWLIATMWTTLGVALAVALRGLALPIGLGLVWMLVVQNLLAGIAAPLIDWIAQMQKWLPGPNAGSLALSLGANPDSPGVGALVSSGRATLMLAAYLVAFAVVGGWLLIRRDIRE